MPATGRPQDNGRRLLDERPLCRRHALEVLRQSIEQHIIRVLFHELLMSWPSQRSPGACAWRLLCRRIAQFGTNAVMPTTSMRGISIPVAHRKPVLTCHAFMVTLQLLQILHDFRLTPGQIWRTDWPSNTPTSGVGVELGPARASEPLNTGQDEGHLNGPHGKSAPPHGRLFCSKSGTYWAELSASGP
jgi:hypothetical protein